MNKSDYNKTVVYSVAIIGVIIVLSGFTVSDIMRNKAMSEVGIAGMELQQACVEHDIPLAECRVRIR